MEVRIPLDEESQKQTAFLTEFALRRDGDGILITVMHRKGYDYARATVA